MNICRFSAQLRLSTVLVFTVIAISLMMTTSRVVAAKHNFKIATLAPDRSVWINAYDEIAREVAAATNGDVKFKCYPGGVQGDELTVIRKMRIGQLHGAGFTGTGLANICRESLALQLPHTFKSYAEFEYVFERMKGRLENVCRTNGYEVLGWPDLGFVYMFSQDRVTDVDTLRSAKPWLIEDDIISKAMFQTAGISGVPAQIGDVLTALRSGLMRTVYAPPVGMVTLQWFTGVKYRLDLKGMYSFGTFIVAKKRWDSLPADVQKEIKQICSASFDKLRTKVHAQNEEALTVLGSKGIETYSPTTDGLQQFEQTSQKVAENLVGNTFSAESLKMVRELRAEYRAKNPM